MISEDDLIKTTQTYLSEKRFNHSIRVKEMAEILQNHHGGDKDVIYKAALLHDIAKEQSPESLSKLSITLPEESFNLWDTYPSVWHSYTGPLLINHLFKFNNVNIDSAVTLHTTGSHTMTLEDKIIFVADTIEPNRTYKERSAIEAIAKKDLDTAIGYIQYFTISKLLSKKKPIHPNAIDCWNAFSKHIINDPERIIHE